MLGSGYFRSLESEHMSASVRRLNICKSLGNLVGGRGRLVESF